jgi:hypothetical protein
MLKGERGINGDGIYNGEYDGAKRIPEFGRKTWDFKKETYDCPKCKLHAETMEDFDENF